MKNIMTEFTDWDCEIDDAEVEASAPQNEKTEFTVLPDGVYKFTVAKVEHSVYQPKEGKTTGITKPCKQIKLGIIVDGGASGKTWSDENLYCWPSCLFRVLLVLKSIGAIPEHGFKGAMPIDQFKGGEGVCHVKKESFKRNDGTQGEKNVIDRFLLPSQAADAIAASAESGEDF